MDYSEEKTWRIRVTLKCNILGSIRFYNTEIIYDTN